MLWFAPVSVLSFQRCHMRKIEMLCTLVTASLLAFGAHAQESRMVLGPTLLEECNNAAAASQRTGHVDVSDIQTCSAAIARSWATAGEIADAYVYRGTLYLQRGEQDKAIA